MTQIWVALCIYLLIAFIKFQSRLTKSMQQILRLLHLNLFEKRDLMALLRGDPPAKIQQDINQSLEAFNKLMYDLDIVADELQRTIQSIEDSPSDLLFKKSRLRPGPGETNYAQ